MTFTILLAAVVVTLGVVGLFRGVRRGVVALAGTLLGAVLVDLWRAPLAAGLEETIRPERPALPTFLLVAAVFVLTALVVGYGGSVMLPRQEPQLRPRSGLINPLLGAMLGAVNGALIVSYLLRYAEQIWNDNTVLALVAGSQPAQILVSWLPWFVMALVSTTAVFVLMRLTLAMMRGRAATGPKPAVPPIIRPIPGGPPAGAAAPPRPSAEADKRLLDEISKSVGKK
jgi:uncharacterized membrane protein required for colicin V production